MNKTAVIDWEGILNSTKRALPSTAIGAGIGAGGMGLATHFLGDEDKETRHKQMISNMLMGGALGGAAGAGAHAIGLGSMPNGSEDHPAAWGGMHWLFGHPAANAAAAATAPMMSDRIKNRGGLVVNETLNRPGGVSEAIKNFDANNNGVVDKFDSTGGTGASVHKHITDILRKNRGMVEGTLGPVGAKPNLTSLSREHIVDTLHATPTEIAAKNNNSLGDKDVITDFLRRKGDPSTMVDYMKHNSVPQATIDKYLQAQSAAGTKPDFTTGADRLTLNNFIESLKTKPSSDLQAFVKQHTADNLRNFQDQALTGDVGNIRPFSKAVSHLPLRLIEGMKEQGIGGKAKGLGKALINHPDTQGPTLREQVNMGNENIPKTVKYRNVGRSAGLGGLTYLATLLGNRYAKLPMESMIGGPEYQKWLESNGLNEGQ